MKESFDYFIAIYGHLDFESKIFLQKTNRENHIIMSFGTLDIYLTDKIYKQVLKFLQI